MSITSSCPATFQGNACVSAKIKIEPNVTINPDDIIIRCVGCAQPNLCPGEYAPYCEFTFHQNLSVTVPMNFGITATPSDEDKGIVCSDGTIIDCTSPCVRSFGYYKNNLDIVEGLLPPTGITLGIPSYDADIIPTSFFYTVYTIDDVLNVFNSISDTANYDLPPESLPTGSLQNAYRALYIQLLVANLNLLSLDASSCAAIVQNLITAANTFLGNTAYYQAGNGDVSNYTAELDAFNTGNTTGCPEC